MRERERETVPRSMFLAAMARASARAASMYSGFFPGEAPQKTQILVRGAAAAAEVPLVLSAVILID